jgi:hypothetical protein
MPVFLLKAYPPYKDAGQDLDGFLYICQVLSVVTALCSNVLLNKMHQQS